MEAFGFSGAFGVVIDGRTAVARAYGLADRARNHANTIETVFNTGSVTKQFTAAAIARCVDEGMLSFDDPVSSHLSTWPDDGITLHHLLTHTSGLEVDAGDDFEMIDRAEFLARVLAAAPAGPPGGRFSYSNAGYGVLAAVLEVVTGVGWERFMTERLWGPAAMTSTGYHVSDRAMVARWYNGDTDEGRSIDRPFPSWTVIGNGEVLSTVADMLAWDAALRDGGVTPASLARMTRPHAGNYGYGFEIHDTPLGRLAAHGGTSSYGSSAFFGRYLDAGSAFVVFCNSAFDGMSTARTVLPLIRRGLETGDVPELPDVEPLPVDGWEGTWAADGVVCEIRDSPHVGSMTLSGGEVAARLALGPPDDGVIERTERVLAAAGAGSDRELAAVITEPERRLSTVWASLSEFVVGGRPSSVSGPMPSQFLAGAHDVLATRPDGAVAVFIWQEGLLVGFAAFDHLDPAVWRLVATGPSEATALHLGWARSVRLRRHAGTLIVEAPGGAATLTRA